MDRRLMIALAIGLTSQAVARADIAYPWYDRMFMEDVRMRNVKTPRVRFEGIEKNTDYIFYLQYSLSYPHPHFDEFYNVPHNPIEIRDEKAIELSIDDHGFASMKLIAVKRVDAARMSKDEKGWISENTPAVLIANLETPETYVRKTLLWRITKDPITTYRIHMEGNNLSVENLSKDKKRSDARLDRLPTIMAGLAISLSMATLGLWFVRRGSR